jgi:hypothetical protein
MKKSDIALLILIVSVSVVISFLLGQAFLGKSIAKPVDVETVQPISADIVEPDSKIFNRNAINPTVPIKIGDTTNQQPFGN